MAPDPHDLPADLPENERKELFAFAARLSEQRPVPAPAFRGSVRRRLEAQPALWRPRRLRVAIAGFMTSGAGLMLVAVASVAGSGPLAAS
jgi:hypothetical protein